jgi:hypothetical protein
LFLGNYRGRPLPNDTGGTAGWVIQYVTNTNDNQHLKPSKISYMKRDNYDIIEED